MNPNILLAAVLAVIVAMVVLNTQNPGAGNGTPSNNTIIVFDPKDAEPIQNIYGGFTAQVMISTPKPVQTSVFINSQIMNQTENGQAELEDALVDVAVVETSIAPSEAGPEFFSTEKAPLSSSQPEQNLVTVGAVFMVTQETALMLSRINNLASGISGLENQAALIARVFSQIGSIFMFFSVFGSRVGQAAAVPGKSLNEILRDVDVQRFAERTDALNNKIAARRGITRTRSEQTSSTDYVNSILRRSGGRSLYGQGRNENDSQVTNFTDALRIATEQGKVLFQIILESEENRLSTADRSNNNPNKRTVYPKVYLFPSSEVSRSGGRTKFGTW